MSYVRRLKKLEAENLDKETLDEYQAFNRLMGYAICQTRQSKCITQMELANFLSIEQSTYSKIETGKIALTVWQLARIAKKLHTPLLELIPPP